MNASLVTCARATGGVVGLMRRTKLSVDSAGTMLVEVGAEAARAAGAACGALVAAGAGLLGAEHAASTGSSRQTSRTAHKPANKPANKPVALGIGGAASGGFMAMAPCGAWVASIAARRLTA